MLETDLLECIALPLECIAWEFVHKYPPCRIPPEHLALLDIITSFVYILRKSESEIIEAMASQSTWAVALESLNKRCFFQRRHYGYKIEP